MTKTRLEAFSDGVIAIIITIMVLELKVPHDTSWATIQPLIPIFICYILSYVFIGIYWGNHHHLLHTVNHVNGKMIWANLHLLFWLSLIPFATAWMGETDFQKISVIIYACLLNLCGIAYYILLSIIKEGHKNNPHTLHLLERQSKKGMLSVALYLVSVVLAFVHTYISAIIFATVAIMWIIPSREIEKNLKEKE